MKRGRNADEERSELSSTVSIRVTEQVRSQIEKAMKLLRGRRDQRDYSLSDAAKLYFNVRDDERLESALLLETPTATMLSIRRKIQSGNSLSRAELIVLGEYIDEAFKRIAGSVSRYVATNSLRVVLVALANIRAHRNGPELELDAYYYETLTPDTTLHEIDAVRSNPSQLTALLDQRISDLEHSPVLRRPACPEARCLFFAIRDERTLSVKALNQALSGVLLDLYKLAARGHWLAHGTAIREQEAQDGSRKTEFPPVVFPPPESSHGKKEGFYVRFSLVGGDIWTFLDSKQKNFTYVLRGFPVYSEFLVMLRSVTPKESFFGQYFHGYPVGAKEFAFRDQNCHMLGFSEQEWQWLVTLFERQMENEANRQIIEEMQLDYGEI